MRRSSLAVLLGVAAVVIVCRHDEPARTEQCPLEQMWYQGDIHYSQELSFDEGGIGAWTTGGMAGDVPLKHVIFRWQKHGSTLTVEADGSRRTVEYRVEPWDHITEGLCFIQFDGWFLPDDQLSRQYTNQR